MEHERFPHKVDDNVAVWAEFRELGEKYNCISLGEGAPGYQPPNFIKEQLIKAIDEGHNQYCRTFGQINLVKKVAEVYGKKLGRAINPLTEVLISPGANSALNSFITAMINPGDEIVLFEPCFPCYLDHIQYAGAIYKPVPLEIKDGAWSFNPEQLRATFTDKTKIFILNNGQNPTGKLFSREELQQITEILLDFPNIIVFSDEVYEFLTFDDSEFISFATLGDNYQKTLTFFSGGKLFSATGWKVGWTIGPAELIKPGALISNTVIYCVNNPASQAMSQSLDTVTAPDYKDGLSYVNYTRKLFQDVRDYMFKELKDGMDLPVIPLHSQSGYFLMVDISKCKDLIPERYTLSHDFEREGEGSHALPVMKNRIFMEDGHIPTDLAFCRWIAIERGVVMMPNCIFYQKDSPYMCDNYVRLAICKPMEHSITAMERLKGKK